jgi:ankyrin repeat protein
VTQMGHRQRGLTILQKAAMLGAVRLCATILKCGADVDKVDSLGKAALHYAVEVRQPKLPGPPDISTLNPKP